MANYEPWEWALLALSILGTIVYHTWCRQSFLGSFQQDILPVWANLHEKSCKQSILMIQLMRNMMSIVTTLSAVMLGMLMMVLKMDRTGRHVELTIVAVLVAAAFIMYVMSANIIANLTFNMALYPADQSPDATLVASNKAKTRRQLRYLSRHFGLGKRLTFIALQSLFVLIHPIALFVATIGSIYLWHYMDTGLGVKMGGMDLHSKEPGSSMVQVEGESGPRHLGGIARRESNRADDANRTSDAITVTSDPVTSPTLLRI